jgi:hypothetical protein
MKNLDDTNIFSVKVVWNQGLYDKDLYSLSLHKN